VEKVKKDVDKHPIKTYIYSMKEINIKVSNILLVELNLVSENWKKYGPVINIKAKNFGKTIKWGKKKHGYVEED
jgi:hypothetical protein